jgi:hypothetical protein
LSTGCSGLRISDGQAAKLSIDQKSNIRQERIARLEAQMIAVNLVSI